MRRRLPITASLILACLLITTGCGVGSIGRWESATPTATQVLGLQAECEPRFPDQGGWLGGDAAASVVLPRGGGRSSLWLFGDSFVEGPGAPRSRSYPFVHNSIAISHCDEQGRWQLDYAWRRSPNEAPRAFFEPDPRADWVERIRHATGDLPYYWPISAVSVDGAVYVALLRVAPATASGPFRLPFRLVGVDLARVEPSDRPPEQWPIQYSTLSERMNVFPAASLVVDGDWLRVFAFLERGDGRSPRILLRLSLASLASGRASLEGELETLAEDGRWIAGLDPDRARILMDDDASEMSVHFDPGLREWLAVYSDPTGSDDDTPSDTIVLRHAASLTGPWSAPTVLLRAPELASASDPEPGEPFCYAGKAHPELAVSGALLVTWVCNFYAESDEETPAVLERLRATKSFYRPHAIRLAVPR